MKPVVRFAAHRLELVDFPEHLVRYFARRRDARREAAALLLPRSAWRSVRAALGREAIARGGLKFVVEIQTED